MVPANVSTVLRWRCSALRANCAVAPQEPGRLGAQPELVMLVCYLGAPLPGYPSITCLSAK